MNVGHLVGAAALAAVMGGIAHAQAPGETSRQPEHQADASATATGPAPVDQARPST